jgi:hypothetical protein
MGASIQRLRHHISRLPFLSFLRNRDDVVELRGHVSRIAKPAPSTVKQKPTIRAHWRQPGV